MQMNLTEPNLNQRVAKKLISKSANSGFKDVYTPKIFIRTIGNHQNNVMK